MKNSSKKWALFVSLACLPVFATPVFADDTPAASTATAPADKPATDSAADTTPAATETAPATADEAPAPAEKKKNVTHHHKKNDGDKEKSTAVTFKNDVDKISYIIGHQIATSITNDSLKINEKELVRALKEGLKGVDSKIAQNDAQAFMQQYFTAQQKLRGDENLKIGKDFLDKNKSAPGVVTLPSGLQYKIISSGTGKTPKTSDSVTVNYEGTLISGKVFDSSYQRDQPVTFPVTGVIKGWTEALQLMPEGSTWMLYVPANLAYGERAPSAAIGPNQTLVFKVNLTKVNDPAPAKAPGAVSSSKSTAPVK